MKIAKCTLDIILAMLYIAVSVITIYDNYNLDITNQNDVNRFITTTLTLIIVGVSLIVVRVLTNNKV